MAEFPLDWTTLPSDKPLYEADVDLSGPIADHDAHLSVIRDAAVPLPAGLTGLLTDLVCRLDCGASPSRRRPPECFASAPGRPAASRQVTSLCGMTGAAAPAPT
ncbi:hypothetical protein [Streptomyces sp. NRRL F-2580]|uniref:hypothetical protein n=1 Tax=Streptomyces sp. NRRL F-2580 TaxID=1463841 RepID=UPI0004C97E78|nr:hypothetical protein [Streptomyces sp. NRRL F-2580]